MEVQFVRFVGGQPALFCVMLESSRQGAAMNIVRL